MARVDELIGLLPSMDSGVVQLSGAQRQHLASIKSFGEALARAFEEMDSIVRVSAQVIGSSKEYQKVVSGAEQNLLETLESFDLVLIEYEKSSRELKGLAGTTGELGDLAEMMSDLSLRIKQLVRNAEIKAYHAGSQGKGFGVIAENMSRLAGEMEKTASLVPVLTEGIRSGVERIASGMDLSRNTVLELKEQAGAIKTRILEVNQANQQTASAFDEISLKARDQRDIRDRLVGGINQISRVADDLMVSQEVVAAVLSTEKAELGLAGSARSSLKEAIDIHSRTNQPWAAAQAGRGMDMLTFRLAGAAERWRDLQHTLEELRASIRSEEVQSGTLWHELEHLFDNINSIQRHLEAVETGINRSRDDFELMSASLDDLFKGLGSIMEWLDGFQSERLKIQKDLKGVVEAGTGIKDFTEQIKLLSFYAAVEVAEMGQSGADFGGIVSQAQALAKKAADDSGKLWPLLDRLGRQFETTAQFFQKARQAASGSQQLVDRARASLKGSRESASAFSGSGKAALDEIRRQIDKHQEIFRLYRSYADNFKDLEKKFLDFSVLLGTFQNILSHLGQSEDLKGDQLVRLQATLPSSAILQTDLSSDPITLDPAMMTDATSNQIAVHIHQGLVQFGQGSNVVPALAWRWRISSDGLSWTFFLRRGAMFSHGREVVAGDVKYSLERMLDPKVKCPNAYFVEMIKGAKEFREGKARHVEGIKVLDSYTVRFELQYPFMPFLSNLACTMTAVVPREKVEGRAHEFSKLPCGAGPFMLERWETGTLLELKRNPGYYQPGLALAGISYRIGLKDEEKLTEISKGGLDLTTLSSLQYKEMKGKQGINLMSLSQLNIQYLCINVSKATPFANLRVRQALNYAIDRQALINHTDLAGSAIVAKGIFPPELPSYNPDLQGYTYNPGKARELLNGEGFAHGVPGEFLLDYREGKAQTQRAELVRSYCQEIGINIKPNPLSWKDLLDKTYGGESVLSFNGWSSDNGDPDNFLYPLFHSKNWGKAGNTSFFKSPIIDELLDEAVAIRSPDERLRRYRRIEQMIVEQAPWVFLFHNLKHVAVRDRVHGYRPRAFGPESLRDCWLEQ